MQRLLEDDDLDGLTPTHYSKVRRVSTIAGVNLIVFVVWLTDERRLASFPAGTIVRDPHHCESPARREQDLNLHRT